MAESISDDMEIITLLPASLENNFVGEVKQWGKNELDIYGTLWKFIPFEEIENNSKIRKSLLTKYKVTADIIKEILNHAIRTVKKRYLLQLIEDDPDIQNRKKELLKKEMKNTRSYLKK